MRHTNHSGTPPVRFGAAVSLTGALSLQGNYVREGYDLFAKQINATGGILGRPVELILYDDQSDKTLVANLYEQLIVEDGVDFLLGPYGSEMTEVVAGITEKHQRVMIAPSATVGSIWAKGYHWLFKITCPLENAGAGILALAAQQGLKRVAFVHQDAMAPRAIAASAGAAISQSGGPGQHLRGPDPLDDPEKRRWIEALLAERRERIGFNAVLTRQHNDLRALKTWFAEKFGPDIFVGLEGVVNVYDAATAIGTGRFERAELNSLTRSIFEALVEDPNAFGQGHRIDEFYASIQRQRPIEALGQKCGMDREDAIAVDLRGNVMTCQNTGAKGVHKIGHVVDFDAIALDTATHFAFREECMSCPVVQLCKGSCMFLEGEFFKQSCANEFAFNMGIMMAAVWHFTGMVVVGVNAIDLG